MIKNDERDERNFDKERSKLSGKAAVLAQAKSTLSAERIALIRRRIAEKYYDQEDVLEEVATRMSGEKELQIFMANVSYRSNL